MPRKVESTPSPMVSVGHGPASTKSFQVVGFATKVLVSCMNPPTAILRPIRPLPSARRREPLQAAGAEFLCSRVELFSSAAAGHGRRHDHQTTVDHALMRGLVTAGPVMRRGASSV